MFGQRMAHRQVHNPPLMARFADSDRMAAAARVDPGMPMAPAREKRIAADSKVLGSATAPATAGVDEELAAEYAVPDPAPPSDATGGLHRLSVSSDRSTETSARSFAP
jgi:hypothetical protein